MDQQWLPMAYALRDGTPIELRNTSGIAPWYGLFAWVNGRWVSLNRPGTSVDDGRHLTWRRFNGKIADYVDPTGGEQDRPSYWLKAAGGRARDTDFDGPMPTSGMTLLPGGSMALGRSISFPSDGPFSSEIAGGFHLVDVSAQTLGKFQHCTMHDGLWYADSDFDSGFGFGMPKAGVLPSPHQDTAEKTAAVKAMYEARAAADTAAVLKPVTQPSASTAEVAARPSQIWAPLFTAAIAVMLIAVSGAPPVLIFAIPLILIIACACIG